MKQILACFLAFSLVLSLAACGKPREIAYVTTVPTVTETPTVPSTEPLAFTYADLKNQAFYFSSGAGGWRTELYIFPDGQFSGSYTDSNMGESGDGYQGAQYRCNFTGQLGQPEQRNAYTLSLPLLSLICEKDDREIRNGVLYCYGGEAYGIDGTGELLLYLPGAPLAELPRNYCNWVGYYDLAGQEEETLPFYGLYNETQETGFSSFDEIQSLWTRIAAAEDQSASLDETALTQADMNLVANTKYEMWDSILNHVWKLLLGRLEEDARKNLIAEERAWIAEKEAAVKEAGKEVEGGTLYPAVTSGTAARLTRERVYVLMDYLEST